MKLKTARRFVSRNTHKALDLILLGSGRSVQRSFWKRWDKCLRVLKKA